MTHNCIESTLLLVTVDGNPPGYIKVPSSHHVTTVVASPTMYLRGKSQHLEHHGDRVKFLPPKHVRFATATAFRHW